ncbi:hypothetical protein FIV42_13800 [Persicimonas caeni]|uniref:Band 7 domain-containing protein n=1 Tax=Persicimonas caeni TaxID=2292766 RepID=A0A4Y6PU54_PERCE|nr:SPFH domain-containing protein [Persicimonas caeni]QDG51780.1 hypothetical protein FIV42_13800 [Persicimonas caeni]QED33001.1 hypothetical protein FRD00_13795 [Persicimonas caeni]
MLVVALGFSVVWILGSLWMLKRSMRSVAPHEALVIMRSAEPHVAFSRALVLPYVQEAYVLSTKTVEVPVQCVGQEACRTADNLKADVEVSFWVKVNRTREDVLRVVETHGCEKASDPEFVRSLFRRKFVETLRTVVRSLDYDALEREFPKIGEQVVRLLGPDLGGFVIEEFVVESCKATALEHYDEHDPLDRQGLARLDGSHRGQAPVEPAADAADW